MAHCANCHETFGSVNSFDRHRTFGQCTPPEDLGLYFNPTRRCWSESYSQTTFVGVEAATARIDQLRERTFNPDAGASASDANRHPSQTGGLGAGNGA